MRTLLQHLFNTSRFLISQSKVGLWGTKLLRGSDALKSRGLTDLGPVTTDRYGERWIYLPQEALCDTRLENIKGKYVRGWRDAWNIKAELARKKLRKNPEDIELILELTDCLRQGAIPCIEDLRYTELEGQDLKKISPNELRAVLYRRVLKLDPQQGKALWDLAYLIENDYNLPLKVEDVRGTSFEGMDIKTLSNWNKLALARELFSRFSTVGKLKEHPVQNQSLLSWFNIRTIDKAFPVDCVSENAVLDEMNASQKCPLESLKWMEKKSGKLR